MNLSSSLRSCGTVSKRPKRSFKDVAVSIAIPTLNYGGLFRTGQSKGANLFANFDANDV